MKNNKATNKKEQINTMVNKMLQNHFLMPNSFSEQVQMANEEWAYKTYVQIREEKERYASITIYPNGTGQTYSNEVIDIQLRSNGNIRVEAPVELRIGLDEIFDYIKAIYTELHSFDNHAEGKRKIREQIKKQKEVIAQANKEIEELEKQLEDLAKLESNGEES